MKNKIIFLDIDGVINTKRSTQVSQYVTNRLEYGYFDSIAMGLVNLLCKTTGAKIVISSSWRITHDKEEIFNYLDHYFPNFTKNIHKNWATPATFSATPRAIEIKRWLDENEMDYLTDKYVILDDDPLVLGDVENLGEISQKICNHHVMIEFDDGISWQNYLKAYAIINSNPTDLPKMVYDDDKFFREFF